MRRRVSFGSKGEPSRRSQAAARSSKKGKPRAAFSMDSRVFANSPWLLGGELAKMRLKKIFDYVLSPTYQQLAPDLGLIRTSKGTFAKGHGLRLHDLEYYQKHGQLDELLAVVGLLAVLPEPDGAAGHQHHGNEDEQFFHDARGSF